MNTSLSYLFWLPVALALVGLLAAWLYYALARRGNRDRLSSARLYRCGACRHVYEDVRDVPLARCTHCGEMNEAIKR